MGGREKSLREEMMTRRRGRKNKKGRRKSYDDGWNKPGLIRRKPTRRRGKSKKIVSMILNNTDREVSRKKLGLNRSSRRRAKRPMRQSNRKTQWWKLKERGPTK